MLSVGTISLLNNLNKAEASVDLSAQKIATNNNFPEPSVNPSDAARARALENQAHDLSSIVKNAEDAKSLLKTADAGIGSISNLMTRLKDLSLQASNDWISGEERDALKAETEELLKEVQRTALTTRYKDTQLLSGASQGVSILLGDPRDTEHNSLLIPLSKYALTLADMEVEDLDLDTREGALEAVEAIDSAMMKLQEVRSTNGALMNRAESASSLASQELGIYQAQVSFVQEVDLALVTTEFVKSRIQRQANLALLVQAQDFSKSALRLLEK